jgi:hypothetical protein
MGDTKFTLAVRFIGRLIESFILWRACGHRMVRGLALAAQDTDLAPPPTKKPDRRGNVEPSVAQPDLSRACVADVGVCPWPRIINRIGRDRLVVVDAG